MVGPQRSLLRISAWLFAGCLLASMTAHAAGNAAQKIRFASGADKAQLKGSLKGSANASHDFLITLAKGQTLSLDLVANPAGTVFYVVLPPARPGTPPAREGEGRSKGTARAALDGDYTVRVFLTRDAAAKGAKASFTLAVSIL